MPADIKEIFRRVIEQLDEEERNELLIELKDKKLSGKELVEAIRALPENERAEVREAFIDVADRPNTGLSKEVTQLEKDAEEDEENKPVDEEGTKEETEKAKEKKRKTRPGRKNGRAYGFYIDEKGRVKVSDVAQVYSGDDEPDEVEVYEQEEEEEDEEEI